MNEEKTKMKLLDKISSPEDIKQFSPDELTLLAREIREKIIDVTSKNGGHIASSLGAVELAIALHFSLNSPKDKIVWDVGHQGYAHKLLTGRAKRFDTLRELGGISGFPNKNESEHDPFTCGHSATSISSALGLAAARDILGESSKIVAVIGDASLATGLAFEAMNHAGHSKTNLVVILNDNEHFISKPVGAMSKYLTKVLTNPLYNKVKEESEKIINSIPKVGPVAVKTVRKFQEGLKNLLVPGILFEELGFRYFGPVDGHNIMEMVDILERVSKLNEPIFIHAITRKGKGYAPSEKNPTNFHGISSFDKETGKTKTNTCGKNFTEHFSNKIVELAEKDNKIVAITAAMPDGTGLTNFEKKFPNRFFDVGITESHAVTFAAGLARGGLKPVVAIYSTFLQRSFDQLIHDVALQNLHVVFCLDRAGLVGRDGPTHHGSFDITYTRVLPNFTVMAPKDGIEFDQMLEEAINMNSPVVIRYPKDVAERVVASSSCAPLKLGTSEVLRNGKDVTILAVGSMVNISLEAADILSKNNIEAGVINARYLKPLDKGIIIKYANQTKKMFIVEENVISGGFASSVLELFSQENITGKDIKCYGLPDEFIEHGSRKELLRKYNLTKEALAEAIRTEIINEQKS